MNSGPEGAVPDEGGATEDDVDGSGEDDGAGSEDDVGATTNAGCT